MRANLLGLSLVAVVVTSLGASGGKATKLAIKQRSVTVTAGQCAGLQVSLENAAGQNVTASSPILISLSTSGHARFYADSQCATAPTQTATIRSGQQKVQFFFQETVVGQDAVTASAAGLSSASLNVLIKAAGAAKLVFVSGPPASIAVNTPFSVSIAVQDGYGNIVSLNQTVTLSAEADSLCTVLASPSLNTAVQSQKGIATFASLVYSTPGVITLKGSTAGGPSVCSAAITVVGLVPNSPTGLTATTLSSSSISLGWTAPGGNISVTGYQVLRNGTAVATVAAPATTFIDTALSAGTSYSYQVLAVNGAGLSSPSNTATAITANSATSSVWQCLGAATAAIHHSTLPKTTTCVISFSDQISGGLPDLLIHFAATHFAGVQKMLPADTGQLRAYNPNWVLLHYQLGMGASPAAYIRGVTVNGSLVAEWSASWPEVTTEESWFMHNDNAVRHCGANDYNCILNIADPNVQNWWFDEAIAAMRAAGAQGVFADTFIEGISGYDVVPPDNRFASANPANPSAWPNGVTWLDQRLTWINAIAATFAQTPEQFLLIPNIGSGATGWDTTNSGIDGAMLEGIALDFMDTPDWTLEMNRAVALTSSGKIVIFQTYPRGDQGTSMFQQDVNYALASYLLVKGDYTYINLPGGNANTGTGIYYYPQYEALEQLGGSLGALPSDVGSYLWAGVYRRDFQNGLVLVNPSGAPISITLPQAYQQLQCSGGGEVGSADIDAATSNYAGGSCSLQSVTSVTLAPWSGGFLFDGGVSLH